MASSSILFVTPWLLGGGIERTIQVKVPWLAARGHRVEVMAWHVADRVSDGPNPTLEALRAAGVPVRRLRPRRGLQLLQHAARVALHAVRGGFPVVVGHELHGNVVVLLAKVLTGGRLRAIAQVHNEPLTYAPTGASRRLMALAARLYRYADGTVAVAEDLRLAQIATFRVDPQRVVTINNPFPVEQIAAAARAPLEHADPTPFIVACGRLTELKGFDDLIRAFAAVRRRRSRLRLVILGDGPEHAALERLAGLEGVKDDVDLPGFATNPYAWFGHARCFVLSSRSEGLANVLVEAMIAGAPIVSSRCAGAAEVIEDGQNGLLYDPGDVEGLVRALDAVLDDPEGAARRANAARKRAAGFAAERILPRLERYYLGEPEERPARRAAVSPALHTYVAMCTVFGQTIAV
jgi:glycosyltransferase involved in cell wall biosynthesis